MRKGTQFWSSRPALGAFASGVGAFQSNVSPAARTEEAGRALGTQVHRPENQGHREAVQALPSLTPDP